LRGDSDPDPDRNRRAAIGRHERALRPKSRARA
jgi:hypothetical protein